jgi:DNA-binding response OmpR family regulator
MISYDLSCIKVLIVEKQAPMRSMLRQILHEFGVSEVFDAASPEDGFETFNQARPDLVLTDWAPDFDGLELVRKIRNDETSVFPHAAVIMVTAYSETDHIYEALDVGMTEFLSKPLSAKLLYLRIASVIENKRPFVRSAEFNGPDHRRKMKNISDPERRSSGQHPK